MLGGGGDFAGLAEHAARGRRGGRRLGAQLLALGRAALDDAKHLLVEIIGVARLAGVDLGAGDLHGVMDEDVDLHHLDVAQGAAQADQFVAVGDAGAERGEGGLGLGGDAG